MRKTVLLSILLCLLLWGCKANDATDGIEFFQMDDAIWTSATETTPADGEMETEHIYCILNTSSKKFHDPTCSSVAKIGENNRSEYRGKREDLLTRGYEPCKICNP